MLRGWASAHQGKASEAAADLVRALQEYSSLSKLLYAFFYSDLAETYYLGGDGRLALTAIDKALSLSDQNSELFWRAEMLRLKGDILSGSSAGASGEAEVWYREALDLSRDQSAKSLELRIVVSIGRLLKGRGDSGTAYDLIAPVYNRFTEGFGTADLAEAKSLLDELRS
jgi:tetratricopeptide (TPR) repeat protein